MKNLAYEQRLMTCWNKEHNFGPQSSVVQGVRFQAFSFHSTEVEADKILGVVTSVDKHRNKRGVHQALSHRKQEIKSKYARSVGTSAQAFPSGAEETHEHKLLDK
eukprot:6466836-Amphidinium_carterae.1